jgi:hypothetical protein
MPEIRESVILATLGVILISIPAASQNVEIRDDEDFSGVIDSEFSDQFEVDFNPGKLIMKAVDSEASFHMNRSYTKNVYELQTAEGYIKKVETNSSIIRTVQTPYGRFKSGVKNGDNFTEFEGGDREKARKVKDSLDRKFEERLSEAKEKKQVVMSRILPDVELEVETDNDIEHFNLTNNGEDAVDLEGWQVMSEEDNRYFHTLEEELKPGETVVYHSKEKDEVGDYENAVYDTGLTIYSNDARVVLYNPEERVVDAVEY